jgi:hypothetical protein
LGEVCDRVADGTADMRRGGGAEDFGGMHARVDRLDEQEDDSRAAEERTEQEMIPMRVHRPQERLVMSPVSAHQSGPSTILCYSGVGSVGEYRGKPLRSQRACSSAGPTTCGRITTEGQDTADPINGVGSGVSTHHLHGCERFNFRTQRCHPHPRQSGRSGPRAATS